MQCLHAEAHIESSYLKGSASIADAVYMLCKLRNLHLVCLQESVHGLREQVRLLRSQRQRDVVLAHLPTLRLEAQQQSKSKGPAKCTALDVLQRLQLEPSQTPKVTIHLFSMLLCLQYPGLMVQTSTAEDSLVMQYLLES